MQSSDIFADLGVTVPDILLPRTGTDWTRWAVIACDQHSSEREYWERVAALVGHYPSTLELIFPECYLEDGDRKERVDRIQASMKDYLTRGLLSAIGPGFILVERSTPYEKEPRKGLMIAVDLEKYVYGKDSKSLIRPTEGTIVERLPPRMEIRRGAPLELPHIMLLLDDPGCILIEPLHAARERLRKVYDFDLMLGSGRVRGWRMEDEASLTKIAKALRLLADPAAFKARHGRDEILLFAVGDGNHSLATAKAIWEETKIGFAAGDPRLAEHPARFALAELVNIYDPGLPFHPIHRLLFDVDEARFFEALAAYQSHEKMALRDSEKALALCHDVDQRGSHRIAWLSAKGAGTLTFTQPRHKLAAGTIQEFLDGFLAKNAGVGIDYIHGTESLISLAKRPGNLGLYLPPIDKGSFFATVIRDGVMPRKTFSMGEAPEKRFYVEARKITV